MIGLSLTTVLTTALLYFSTYVQYSTDIARSNILYIPLILSVGVAVIYSLSWFLIKRYNWLITLFGILLLVYIAVPIYFLK